MKLSLGWLPPLHRSCAAQHHDRGIRGFTTTLRCCRLRRTSADVETFGEFRNVCRTHLSGGETGKMDFLRVLAFGNRVHLGLAVGFSVCCRADRQNLVDGGDLCVAAMANLCTGWLYCEAFSRVGNAWIAGLMRYILPASTCDGSVQCCACLGVSCGEHLYYV